MKSEDMRLFHTRDSWLKIALYNWVNGQRRLDVSLIDALKNFIAEYGNDDWDVYALKHIYSAENRKFISMTSTEKTIPLSVVQCDSVIDASAIEKIDFIYTQLKNDK